MRPKDKVVVKPFVGDGPLKVDLQVGRTAPDHRYGPTPAEVRAETEACKAAYRRVAKSHPVGRAALTARYNDLVGANPKPRGGR